jgi:aryl-alcohol dehydrogenase-like predicted oxidoreductase
MLPLCEAEGIGVIPWSPLARGHLARPWNSEATTREQTDAFGKKLYGATQEADRKIIECIAEIAGKRGIPQAQVALAWLLQKRVVTAPIVGATKPHHLEDAIGALSVKLSADEVRKLEEPYIPHAIAGLE